MKLYNSILAPIDESIVNMDKSIDPFNIMDIEYIMPDPSDEFIEFIKIINDNDLQSYTVDFNTNNADLVYLGTNLSLLLDQDTKEKVARLTYYICNKMLPKINDYFKNPWGMGRLVIELSDITNGSIKYFAHISPYKGIGGYKLNIGIYNCKDITVNDILQFPASVIMVSYKNNLITND